MKRLIDILPKITQWESVPYSAGLCCKGCGKADVAYGTWNVPGKICPLMVGWAETGSGLMAVFECPECHSRFRCHCGAKHFAEPDEFNEQLEMWVSSCANYDELKKQMEA